jgi:hypothetical protein
MWENSERGFRGGVPSFEKPRSKQFRSNSTSPSRSEILDVALRGHGPKRSRFPAPLQLCPYFSLSPTTMNFHRPCWRLSGCTALPQTRATDSFITPQEVTGQMFAVHPELPGMIVDWYISTLIKTPGREPDTKDAPPIPRKFISLMRLTSPVVRPKLDSFSEKSGNVIPKPRCFQRPW